MFWPDVVSLKQFYLTPCGGYAAQLMRSAIRRVWPNARGEAIGAVGYGVPYLIPYADEAATTLAVMPAGQGVMAWPATGANRAVLADETMLPLADASLDRLLLVHVLEHTEEPRALLDECWRVLSPGGRLLVLVPNRRGLWVRALDGPFAYGHGYSVAQLKSLLTEQRFTMTDQAYALYLPPTQRGWWLRAARFIEGLGTAIFLGARRRDSDGSGKAALCARHAQEHAPPPAARHASRRAYYCIQAG